MIHNKSKNKKENQMKTKVFLLSLISFSLLLACSSKNDNKNYLYKFIDTKTESASGNNNKMDLYAFSGDINITILKDFCKDQKNNFDSGTFYFIVIFDDVKNAAFPTTPFTAAYGTEENSQKHIRAIYTYNKLNGYSSLDYYEKNKWESPAKSEKI